jgi:hypothetical protein
MTKLRTGRPEFNSWQCQWMDFFFVTTSKPILGPTQPPIQWVPGALTPRIKWPERESDNSPPFTVEINAWSYAFTPKYLFMEWRLVKTQGYVFMAWYFVKHRNNFTCTFTFASRYWVLTETTLLTHILSLHNRNVRHLGHESPPLESVHSISHSRKSSLQYILARTLQFIRKYRFILS